MQWSPPEWPALAAARHSAGGGVRRITVRGHRLTLALAHEYARTAVTVDRDQSEDARRALVTRQRRELLKGELVEEDLLPAEPSISTDHAAINAKYDRGEIRIVTEQARYPLESIADLLQTGNYQLDPDYQRRHRWNAQQRSRLIESFIMNVPVPPIFLYEWDYGKYEVMDGLQRLTAVRDFYSNAFRLTGLEYWKELDGLRCDELPERIRAGVNRRYLSSIVLLKETSHGDENPELLKRFVFGRINTGGVKLSPQELRNALYDGPMNVLCKRLSRSPALRRLWGIPEKVEDLVEARDEREEERPTLFGDDEDRVDATVPRDWRDMTDVELVLRFFANRQRMIVYRDNIRDYLDAYLQAANRFEPRTLDTLATVYVDTLDLAEELFGENAFRRPRSGGTKWGNVPSKGIYDAIMNVLSRLLPERQELVANAGAIRDGLLAFYDRNNTVFNLRGQTRGDLMTREILLEDYLRSFVSGHAGG